MACKYCTSIICETCTTERESKKCSECKNYNNWTFKWNYCPMCGELIRIKVDNYEYKRNRKLDIDNLHAYESSTAPHKIHILLIDEKGNKEFTY